MKKRISMWGTLGVALSTLATLAPSASASVVGTFNLSDSNCGTGITNIGVTVTATTIDWLPAGGGFGCIQVGSNALGTPYVTFSGGSIGPGEQGTIQDILAPIPVTGMTNFLNFAGIGGGSGSISFTLNPLVARGLPACTSGMAVNTNCSVSAASPFLLTKTSETTSSVSLSLTGTVSDGTTPSSTWNGSFTTQFGLAPVDIQNFILGLPDTNTNLGCVSGACTNTYSGSLRAGVVPEPGSMFLIGAGLVGLASLRRRKK